MSFKFDLASDVSDADAVITAQSLPGLTGNGSENLHCGSCGEVLAANLVPDAIHRMFPTDRRLILRCTCGGDNVVGRETSVTAPTQAEG